MAGDASRTNGKKGGRPKGLNAISAEKARAYIAGRVANELEPIVTTAIGQAKEGDKSAREWLFDRAHGKAPQGVELSGKDGEAINILFDSAFEKRHEKY